MLTPTPDRRANSRVVPGPLARTACRTILISPRGRLMAQFQHGGHRVVTLTPEGCGPTATAGSASGPATARWCWCPDRLQGHGHGLERRRPGHGTVVLLSRPVAGPRPRPGAPTGRPGRGGAGTRRLRAHGHSRERRQADHGPTAGRVVRLQSGSSHTVGGGVPRQGEAAVSHLTGAAPGAPSCRPIARATLRAMGRSLDPQRGSLSADPSRQRRPPDTARSRRPGSGRRRQFHRCRRTARARP